MEIQDRLMSNAIDILSVQETKIDRSFSTVNSTLMAITSFAGTELREVVVLRSIFGTIPSPLVRNRVVNY